MTEFATRHRCGYAEPIARIDTTNLCPTCKQSEADAIAEERERIAAHERRADYAEGAVDEYVRSTSRRSRSFREWIRDGEEGDTAVADLIGDLRHFCDREGIDFDEAAARGSYHYEEEKAGR